MIQTWPFLGLMGRGKMPKAEKLGQGSVGLRSRSTAGWLCCLERDTGLARVGRSQSRDRVAGSPDCSLQPSRAVPPPPRPCTALISVSTAQKHSILVVPLTHTQPLSEPGLVSVSREGADLGSK